MPETHDTDWDWNDFFHRNNDELVATWGNLANRVLSLAFRHWEGRVPEPGELTELDCDLLEEVNGGFETVGDELEAVHLRGALTEAMRLATEVNKYLDTTAPWTAIKSDRQAAARAIYTALKAIELAEGDAVAFPALHLREAAWLPGVRYAVIRRAKRGNAHGRAGRAPRITLSRGEGDRALGAGADRGGAGFAAAGAAVPQAGCEDCGRGTGAVGKKIIKKTTPPCHGGVVFFIISIRLF